MCVRQNTTTSRFRLDMTRLGKNVSHTCSREITVTEISRCYHVVDATVIKMDIHRSGASVVLSPVYQVWGGGWMIGGVSHCHRCLVTAVMRAWSGCGYVYDYVE